VSPRALLLLAVLGSAPAGLQAADEPGAAEPARLAAQGLLIALAAAGERLVAVGDRGVIVFSDDHGHSWTQSPAVPTQALLTGVCFFDAQRGVAVGHDLVALTTADAGRTWQRVHYDPGAQRPLLDVWCGSNGQAIAVGAYSTYLTSADAGASWQERPFHPVPARAASAAKPGTPPPDADAGGGGFHLNRIVAGGGGRLYIAAEAGHVYRSADGGEQWRELPSPYAGSFFGALPLEGEVLLAYGLRGNLYRSADGGDSWQRLDAGTLARRPRPVAATESGRAGILGRWGPPRRGSLDWAFAWVLASEHGITESYVNLIPTVEGGTHVNGLRSGAARVYRIRNPFDPRFR
jgi:photosystem II stability/assembly factor-like uncharacterized protein